MQEQANGCTRAAWDGACSSNGVPMAHTGVPAPLPAPALLPAAAALHAGSAHAAPDIAARVARQRHACSACYPPCCAAAPAAAQIEAEYAAAAKSKNPKRPIGFDKLPEAAPATTNMLLDYKTKKSKKRWVNLIG